MGQLGSRVLVEDGVSVVELGHVALCAWSRPASRERWDWKVQRLDSLVRRNPKGIVVLDVIHASATPPGAALRSQMKADLDRLSDRMIKFVVLPVGDGVWVSVVRSIVRGMLMLGGMTRKYAVVSSTAEAVATVAEVSAIAPDAVELAIGQALDAVGLHHGSTAA